MSENLGFVLPYKLEPIPCRTCPIKSTLRECTEMMNHDCAKYETWLKGWLGDKS